jgi:hypothetical protein
MIIATALPRTACHTGTEAGRFSARRSPVTTADKSLIVLSFLTILLNINSKSTADTVQDAIKIAARKPKNMMAAADAGKRAITTSSIIDVVSRFVYM